uniref:Uncharacterized protein n=1 Tax=Sphaerodactylus townsendi TaxID=933632 RepID=A0ACB8GF45_9SAUR
MVQFGNPWQTSIKCFHCKPVLKLFLQMFLSVYLPRARCVEVHSDVVLGAVSQKQDIKKETIRVAPSSSTTSGQLLRTCFIMGLVSRHDQNLNFNLPISAYPIPPLPFHPVTVIPKL